MQSTGKEDPAPVCSKSEMVLGRCLIEGDPDVTQPAHGSRRRAFGVSFAIETSLLVLLVTVPLFSTGAQLQLHQILPPQLTFFGSWREHDPVQTAAAPITAHKPLIQDPFMRPAIRAAIMDFHHAEAPELPGLDLPGEDVPGAIPLIEKVWTQSPVEPPYIGQKPAQEKRPVKISEGVLQAQLIFRIEPRYPPFALQTRQSGTVVLRAIINRDGRISALEVVSGSPFFVQAALDAVRQWRYRPTLLNGEPVEVETTITVVFHLQS